MKSGPEIVKAGLRSFFESAADDIEKMVENLKLGKVSKGNQVRNIVDFPSMFFKGHIFCKMDAYMCPCSVSKRPTESRLYISTKLGLK